MLRRLRVADVPQAKEPVQSVNPLLVNHLVINVDEGHHNADEHLIDKDHHDGDDPGIITLAQHVLHLHPGGAVHVPQQEDQHHQQCKE